MPGRLFPDLSLAKGDGRYSAILRRLAKTDLLILDDWGLSTLNEEARRDLLVGFELRILGVMNTRILRDIGVAV